MVLLRKEIKWDIQYLLETNIGILEDAIQDFGPWIDDVMPKWLTINNHMVDYAANEDAVG